MSGPVPWRRETAQDLEQVLDIDYASKASPDTISSTALGNGVGGRAITRIVGHSVISLHCKSLESMCCCTVVDLCSLARQSDAFSASPICNAHSQPTFLTTCQNMHVPAGCGSATASSPALRYRLTKELPLERRDD